MEKHDFDFILFFSPCRSLNFPNLFYGGTGMLLGRDVLWLLFRKGSKARLSHLRAQTELQIGPWTVTKHICPLRPHPKCDSHTLALRFQPETLCSGKVTAAPWPAREVHSGVLAELFSPGFHPSTDFSLLAPQRAWSSAASSLCYGLSLTCPSASEAGRAAL